MSTDPRSQQGKVQYGQIISRCNVPRTIALTYDDGPSDNTEKLLDILEQAHAKATFFIAGNTNGKGSIDTTPKWSNIIERMVEEGHQVGSHTWSHPDMDKVGPQTRKTEIVKNERALTNILGKYPTYMRPPYLRCSEPHGCLEDMTNLGYHVVSYTFDSGDVLEPQNYTNMQMRVDQAFYDTAEDGNMILIQHDTITESAIDLTKYVLQKIQERSWQGKYQFFHFVQSKS